MKIVKKIQVDSTRKVDNICQMLREQIELKNRVGENDSIAMDNIMFLKGLYEQAHLNVTGNLASSN